MSPSDPSQSESGFLCANGLAKRQGLVTFVSPESSTQGEETETLHSRAHLQLIRDEAVIREAFNVRCGEINLLDEAAREAQLDKREALIGLIYRLYAVSRERTPEEVRRALRPVDVEALISSTQRLSLMGNPDLRSLTEECERRGREDDDVLAHVMDPFQLRYILAYHSEATRGQIGNERLNTIKTACRQGNVAGVREWFQGLIRDTQYMALDTPQALRNVLLELWKEGEADLGVFAYETAVLDTQLFADLGWESTRAFCAQLRRITGPCCEALDAFLTDEDIDHALTIAQELRQPDLVNHFRKLATTYSAKSHRDLRRNVMTEARPGEPVVETPPAPLARPVQPPAYRKSSWTAAPGVS